MAAISFQHNREPQNVDVPPDMPLLWVLLDTLNLAEIEENPVNDHISSATPRPPISLRAFYSLAFSHARIAARMAPATLFC